MDGVSLKRLDFHCRFEIILGIFGLIGAFARKIKLAGKKLISKKGWSFPNEPKFHPTNFPDSTTEQKKKTLIPSLIFTNISS
jgi:hypothetical protein